MSYIIGVCKGCSATRYRSKEDISEASKPIRAVDFSPVGDQPPGIDGEPVTCYKCGGSLTFVKEPDKMATVQTEGVPRRRPPQQQPTSVNELFSARGDEKILKLEEIGPMKYFIATDRRLLVINVNELME